MAVSCTIWMRIPTYRNVIHFSGEKKRVIHFISASQVSIEIDFIKQSVSLSTFSPRCLIVGSAEIHRWSLVETAKIPASWLVVQLKRNFCTKWTVLFTTFSYPEEIDPNWSISSRSDWIADSPGQIVELIVPESFECNLTELWIISNGNSWQGPTFENGTKLTVIIVYKIPSTWPILLSVSCRRNGI